MSRINDAKEVVEHWFYYQKTAKELKSWKIRFIFHDVEKLLLILIVGDELATKIHRAVSSHHGVKEIKDVLGAIIDWECARFTKPSKQLNARQTLDRYYSHLSNKEDFLKVLDELGI